MFSGWAKGKKAPHLLRKAQEYEKEHQVRLVDRRASDIPGVAKGARHYSVRYGDEQVVRTIVNVLSGEVTETQAAEALGSSVQVVSAWVLGKRRRGCLDRANEIISG
jgi:hypothetical protein